MPAMRARRPPLSHSRPAGSTTLAVGRSGRCSVPSAAAYLWLLRPELWARDMKTLRQRHSNDETAQLWKPPKFIQKSHDIKVACVLHLDGELS